VIFNLGDRRKGNLDDLSVCDLNLDARSGEGLGGLHAANFASHAPAVRGNNLHVVFAVKRLQRGECFGYLHNEGPPDLKYAFYAVGSLPSPLNATGKRHLAYTTCPCILRVLVNR